MTFIIESLLNECQHRDLMWYNEPDLVLEFLSSKVGSLYMAP